MTTLLAPSQSAKPPPQPKRDYLSHSAISTYQACPLRYYFRYIEGLPEATVPASLIFGSAIHTAIELHFRSLLETGVAPTSSELLEAYRGEWQNRSISNVRFKGKETRQVLDQLAVRILTAFPTSELANPGGTILGVEEELRSAILPRTPVLLGRIDLIVESKDAIELTDFKTSRSKWTAHQAGQEADQLLLYGELARQVIGNKSLRLRFGVMTKAKVPTFTAFQINASPKQSQRAIRVIERVWNAIEAKHFYPSPSAMNCGGCPFRGPCDAWQG